MGGDWLWHAGAVLLGGVALSLFVWAWRGDRSRGRARCGRCWYSLDALVDGAGGLPVCPECGWRARRRGQLFRPRRRRGWMALASVVAIGAAAGWFVPRVRELGWWSMAPEWLLLRAASGSGPPTGELAGEIQRRFRFDDWARLAPKAYELNERMRLLRPSWVEGVPIRGRWKSTFIAGPGDGMSVYLDPARLEKMPMNDADPSSNQSHENWWTPGVNLASPAMVTNGRAKFLVSIEAVHRCGMMPEPEPFYAEVTLKRSLDEVLTPLSVSDMEVLGLLGPSVFVLPTTRNLALSVGDVVPGRLGKGVVFGVKMEVIRFGETIASARWYQSTSSRTITGRPVLVRSGKYEAESKDNGPISVSLRQLLDDGCVVRFSTDVEMALCAFECDRYWKGSFEVRLAELVK